METLYENNTVRLVDNSGTLFLCHGNDTFRISSEWHNPDTYLWHCPPKSEPTEKPQLALTVFHAFSEEDIRFLAQPNHTLDSISGKSYDIQTLCQLFLFGIQERMGDIDIDYLEKKYAEASRLSATVTTTPPATDRHVPGYRLEGTLRERIQEMIDLVSIGSLVNLDYTRALYRQAGVPLHPQGERFIKRYGFLFSSMVPYFEDDDDDNEFFFDIFEEYYPDKQEQVEALRQAVYSNGEESHAFQSVRDMAGCPVTPVGLYGYGDCATVYAGENGKLYALHSNSDAVAEYDSIIDLLSIELKDHPPLSLID